MVGDLAYRPKPKGYDMGRLKNGCSLCQGGIANLKHLMPCQRCDFDAYVVWVEENPDLVGRVLAPGQLNEGLTKAGRKRAPKPVTENRASVNRRPVRDVVSEHCSKPLSRSVVNSGRSGLAALREQIEALPDQPNIDDPLDIKVKL